MPAGTYPQYSRIFSDSASGPAGLRLEMRKLSRNEPADVVVMSLFVMPGKALVSASTRSLFTIGSLHQFGSKKNRFET